MVATSARPFFTQCQCATFYTASVFVGVGGLTRDGTLGLELKALRDINPGEEICGSYEYDQVNHPALKKLLKSRSSSDQVQSRGNSNQQQQHTISSIFGSSASKAHFRHSSVRVGVCACVRGGGGGGGISIPEQLVRVYVTHLMCVVGWV